MKTLKITLIGLVVLIGGGYIFQIRSTKTLDINKAPVFATKTITIKANPEHVFKKLADIDHWNTWLANVNEAKLNGPLAPQSTFDWTTNGMHIHSTLQKVNPYSLLEWTGVVYGIYAIHQWEFKTVNGSTTVVVTESMQGLLASLFSSYLNKTLQQDMVTSLAMLKSACE